MDARLHHLQGKAERVKATELLELLTEFYRDKLAMRQRHVAGARLVGDYDVNNTYQYIIAREDLQLTWLIDAVTDLGGAPVDLAEPDLGQAGEEKDAERSVIAQDHDGAQQFVDKWRPRVETVKHARHRTMLNVILGETLEHKRFFEQALAGRDDMLGRRADGAGTAGRVLPTRWVGQT
jgi:hypothetical protein